MNKGISKPGGRKKKYFSASNAVFPRGISKMLGAFS